MSPAEVTPYWFTALGVFVSQDTGRFGHFGIGSGYRCKVLATKGIGHGLVIMTNSDNGERIYTPVQELVDATFAPNGR